MNYIEEAIKRAIEGGYDLGRVNREFASNNFYFCDPLFWQALGKNEWWDGSQFRWLGDKGWPDVQRPTYKEVWHSFIDHLIAGGTPEDFFKELLVKK